MDAQKIESWSATCERLELSLERTERNRDMWKQQCANQAQTIASKEAEAVRLRAALLAWKAEAEFQYGQLRLQRDPSETDYPVDGALDAYARGKHPAIAALTQQPTKD